MGSGKTECWKDWVPGGIWVHVHTFQEHSVGRRGNPHSHGLLPSGEVGTMPMLGVDSQTSKSNTMTVATGRSADSPQGPEAAHCEGVRASPTLV